MGICTKINIARLIRAFDLL